MRSFMTGFLMIVVVAANMSPSLVLAQMQVIQRPTPGQAVVTLPPVQIAVPATTGAPLNVPMDPPHRLQDAPPPQSFLAPGIDGIYAQLNTASRYKTVPFAPYLPYQPYQNYPTPPDASKFNLRQIVVKFVEGSAVRFRDGALVVSADPAATDTAARLSRAGLEPAAVAADLAAFNDQIRSFRGVAGRAAPGVDEMDLLRLRQAAERNTGSEQPDPNLFYFVHLPEVSAEQAQAALQSFMKHRVVETAYFQPIPFNASDKPPTTTIDVTNSQGYFMPARTGIDVNFARLFAGGRGEGVRIGDIEAGWDINHEDLPPMGFMFGVNWGGDHGTAVLGEIAAQENGFGATGIAPNALVGWSSVTNLTPFQPIYFYSVGNALLMLGAALRPGDIALIEQHFPNSSAGPCPNTCNCGQFGFVAVETVPYEHAAISLMTGAGLVVVEAAGNGQVMVTPASPRDSGAIIVGASNTMLVPACFTNFGPRVNVHAWGGSIGSTGFGTDASLRANGPDPDQWYTRTFSGTSGASPIVVGAAALVQGTRMAHGLAPLSSIGMRSLLAATGSPQFPGSTPNIGPMPDLRTAIRTYIPDAATFVDQTPAPGGAIAPGATFTIMERFKNSGGLSWVGSHILSVAPSSGGVAVFGTQGFGLGFGSAPIDPGQIVSPTFSIHAPTQPGSYGLAFVLKNPLGQVIAASPTQQITVTASPTSPVDSTTLTIVSAPGPFKVGLPGIVILRAFNSGTTNWTPPGYGVRVSKSANISLSQVFTPIVGPVPSGQSSTMIITMTCQAPGIGSFTAQMNSPFASFGASAGQTVSCQP